MGARGRVASAHLSAGFKGNKQALPHKPCGACGRPMSWRKRWARVWDTVLYCSERCRRQGRPAAAVDG